MVDFIGGIQHCVKVFGKWIFKNQYYVCAFSQLWKHELLFKNDDETKGMNGYKRVLKSIGLFPTEKMIFLPKVKIQK